MAVTSIWSIKGWIGKVINYAENPDKTKEQTSQELISESETGQLQGLNDVITYAVNAEKTRLRQSKSVEMEVVGESEELMEQYVSGLNCAPTTAREEMIPLLHTLLRFLLQTFFQRKKLLCSIYVIMAEQLRLF